MATPLDPCARFLGEIKRLLEHPLLLLV